MFRVQRELSIRDRHPKWPNWLAWADYLVLSAIVLSLSLVVLPLVALPEPSRFVFSVAGASCAASSLLLLAYPFAILDHYHIEIGAWRTREGEKPEARHKGEPIERVIVVSAVLVTALVFIAIVVGWNF